MLWYLSMLSEMPLKEPDFQRVNTSPPLEVKASQIFLHWWAESLMLVPKNSRSAARNGTATSEMVRPRQGDSLLELTTSLERQDLLDRVSASCTRQYSLLGWSQHLCTAALCCAVPAAHLTWSSTWHLSKTWAYLLYLKPCGYGADITGLHTARRTSSARYR